MKRYSLTLKAGVPVDFDHPGRFFSLLTCVAPVDLSLQVVGQQAEQLLDMWPGLLVEVPDPGFSRLRITSAVTQLVEFTVSMVRLEITSREKPLPIITAETDVNQITGGGDIHGWVSGTPASLAASGTAVVVFDLGPNWMFYGLVQVLITPVAPSSGFNPVQIMCTPNGATNFNRRLGFAYSTGGAVVFGNFTSASGQVCVVVRPMDRYLVINIPNADAVNAVGATAKVAIAAYPSVGA